MGLDLSAVGQQIRTARQSAGLSLGALAAKSGVGKGSLSELENGVRNPTLATLYALAGVLGVPLAQLLTERPGSQIASPGIEAILLDSRRNDDGVNVEVYRLQLDAGATHVSTGHGPGVVEYLLVTRGRVRAGVVGAETEGGPGELLTWTSDDAHGYAALDDQPVDAVLTICTPPALAS